MMEPPSNGLRQLLAELRLAGPRDFRRCRPHVRRLARDLPAFDSVWIDALLQTGRLTPFQARALESHPARRLAVGPCVLIDRLGRGRNSETCLARLHDGSHRCVLKLIRLPPDEIRPALSRLAELTAVLQGLAHPALVGPHTALRHAGLVVTISPWGSGTDLAGLLVRRGRFPHPVVADIARQLLGGLAAIEARGAAHGDVRLANVRLTRGGRVVLVDAGIAPAVSPRLTIHSALPPDRYDGVAPELVGTGRAPDRQSDLYAMGCLLWQLLAGRPPFPTGDPLAKLAAHQTRDIEDVREWAPDTPRELAELIGELVCRDPDQRPESSAELRNRSHWSGRPARRRLARFAATFNRSLAGGRPKRLLPPGRVMTAAVLCLLLGTATLALLGEGIRADVLALLPKGLENFGTDSRHGGGQAQNPTAKASHDAPPAELLPLPAPGPDGVVLLNASGPFRLETLRTDGPLILRGAGTAPAIIEVGSGGGRLAASTIVLEDVVVRGRAPFRTATNQPVGAYGNLLRLQAQHVALRRCRFENGPLDTHTTGRSRQVHDPPGRPAAVEWVAPGGAAASGRLDLTDCVFVGPGDALRLADCPDRVELSNCLKLSGGSLVTLNVAPPPWRRLQIQLRAVTLREAETVTRWLVSDEWFDVGQIDIDATGCVFQLRGREAALVQFTGRGMAEHLPRMVSLSGGGSLVSAPVSEAVLISADGGAVRRLASDALAIEGLSSSPFDFAGPLTDRAADSALRPESIQGPRLSSRVPGIDAGAL